MSGIKIPVNAELDAGDVNQQLVQFQQRINALGQQIAQANKIQFNPVSKVAVEDLKRVTQQFEALKRVSGDLNKRLKATGQKDAGFTDVDWSKLYPDQNVQSRQMRKAFEYVTGMAFHTPATPPTRPNQPPANQNKPQGGGPTWTQMGVGAVQSGLRAGGQVTGGVSNVAANALGTGMSSGFGAGLMGLLGGLGALAIGKAVGAATENIGKAEDNNVSLDRLKRAIGDVSVSFEALKQIVVDSGDKMRISYSEVAKLGAQFAKLGNVSADDYKSIGSEVEIGAGMSRAYGLDLSQGVGVMGQLRGMKVTGDAQESRKFALLIGETIGKSGAFAKADDVMSAIADYATLQTRNGMGAANVSGFTGMYSAMVGSGIPGLDPNGAASLLARVNTVLAAGGAKGEASQFFTGQVGARMGLDPIQTQILREGGAFATNDEAFGKGSIAARYGISGPSGNKTYIEASLDMLREQYKDKGHLAQGTANHLGINMRQAMALLSVAPNQMGEMQKYAGDLTKLNAAGIGNLSKALYGSANDRQDLANSLKRRTGADALSSAEMGRLNQAMESGDVNLQKQVLAELVASRDQEMTTGKAIQESKNALDNIKTAIADKLVPLTQAMREGIMYLAGGKEGKSSEEIMSEQIRIDSQSRAKAIAGEYDPQIAKLQEQKSDYDSSNRSETIIGALTSGETSKKAKESAAQFARMSEEVEKKIKTLEEEKAAKLAQENRARDERIELMKENIRREREAAEADRKAEQERQRLIEEERKRMPVPGGGVAGSGGSGRSAGRGGAGAGQQSLASSLSEVQDQTQRTNLGVFMDAVARSEGANYNTIVGGGTFSDYSAHPNTVGLVTADGSSTAAGRYQITNSTWKGVAKKLGLKDFSPESQDKAMIELLRQRGALNDVLRGDYDAAVAKLGNEWQSLPSGTSRHQGKHTWAEFNSYLANARAKRLQATPVPEKPQTKVATAGPSSAPLTGEMSLRLDLSPGAKRLLQPPQGPMTARIAPATPFGVTR